MQTFAPSAKAADSAPAEKQADSSRQLQDVRSADSPVPAVRHVFSRIPIQPVAAGVVQTKLSINTPGDRYEQEADSVAEQVMRMPGEAEAPAPVLSTAAAVQRTCSCGGGCPDCREENPEVIQRTSMGHAVPSEAAAQAPLTNVLNSPGHSLDSGTRAFMESRFQRDFRNVRIHSDRLADESATALSARAFAVRSHIVFAEGQYRPGSLGGRRLLAHELTHTIQQNGSAGRMVQRKEADAPAPTQAAPKARIGTLFAYQASKSATAVLTGGREVFVLLTENTLPPGSYRLERHNEIPGDFKYRVFRLDDESQVQGGAQLAGGHFRWQAKFSGGDEIALTIASSETSAFFKYLEAPGGLTLTAADRARIAAAIQKAGIARNEWYKFRHPDGVRPRSSAEAASLVERMLAEREAGREAAAQREQQFNASSARTMSAAEGLDTTMTGIYKDYQQLQRLSHLKPSNLADFRKDYPEGWKSIADQGGRAYRTELTGRIEKGLKDFDIAGIPEFEKRIAAFETVFRENTVNLALEVLTNADEVCESFQVEAYNVAYTNAWDEKGKIVEASLANDRSSIQARVEAADEQKSKAVRRVLNSTPWNRVPEEETTAALNAASAARESALDEVSFLLPQFPFIAWPDFPRERLLRKTDSGDVMVLIGDYLLRHRAAIRDTRSQLKSKSARIYKLDLLLSLAKHKFPIEEGSVFDLIIGDEVEKASHESLLEKIETVLLFALMIASVVVTGGASVAVQLAIAGLSAAQAYDLYTQYNADLAAHKANLSSLDPSEFWVIAAMIGAAMDSKAALDAFAGSAALRKAVQDFSKTRALDKFIEDMERLSHQPAPELTEKAAKAIEDKAAEVAKDVHPAAGGSSADTTLENADRDAEDVVAGDGAKAELVAAELEEGVLPSAPSAAKGHRIKITEHGMIVRCTTCAELADTYFFTLDRNPGLARDLAALDQKAASAALAGNRRQLSVIARQTSALEEKILDQAVKDAEGLFGRSLDPAGLRGYIGENPEQFAREMEDRAAILEKQGDASGVEQLGRAGVHEEGMAKSVYNRLRSRTPSDDIRDFLNRGLTPPYPDPILRGLMVTGRVEADHIVPMMKIIEMRGFMELSEENMLAVLNFKPNFVALSEAANRSKGTQLFYDWIRHAGRDTLVDPAFRQLMAIRELRLESVLENEIATRLAAQTAR